MMLPCKFWATATNGICCLVLLMSCGCYSTARHIANVRPELVKPAKGIVQKYRLARLLFADPPYLRGMKKLSSRQYEFQRQMAATTGDFSLYNEIIRDLGYMEAVSAAYRKDIRQVVSELEEQHKKETETIRQHISDALCRHYPSVFTTEMSATPLTVLLTWETSYKDLPNYASLLGYWLWPLSAEQNTIYRISVQDSVGGRSETTLWRDFLQTLKKYPQPVENGSAMRTSVVWETMLLPIGFIPIPGDSDWPKTFCFMRMGKDSLVGKPQDKLQSKKCIRDMIFEPKTDGEVLAAAIMRSINRKCRAMRTDAILSKGGVR